MSKLGKYVQSTGIENFDDGKLETEVIKDDVEATVTEVKGELAEAEVELVSAADAAQALSEESQALEEYCDLLRKGVVSGKMSPRSFSILSVGIEGFTIRTGVAPKDFPSAADFGGRMSQRQAATVSLESLSEVAKKTWEAFKAAMTALFQQIQDYATKLLDGSKKLGDKATTLQTAIKGLKGTPKETEFTLANGAPLAINGEFSGQDVTPVTRMAAVAFGTYYAHVADYIKDIKRVVDGIKFDGPIDASALSRAAFQHAPSSYLRMSTDTKAVEGDSRFPAGATVTHGPVMPGNMAIFLTTLPPEAPSDVAALTKMLTEMKARLLPVQDATPLRGEVTVKVASPQDLSRRITDIVTAVAQINGKTDYADKAKAALNELLTSLDHLKQRADSAKEPAEGAAASEIDPTKTVSDFVAIGQNMQRMIGQDFQGMLAYTVRTLGAYLALIEKEVAAYSVAPAAAAEPAAAPAEPAPAQPA